MPAPATAKGQPRATPGSHGGPGRGNTEGPGRGTGPFGVRVGSGGQWADGRQNASSASSMISLSMPSAIRRCEPTVGRMFLAKKRAAATLPW